MGKSRKKPPQTRAADIPPGRSGDVCEAVEFGHIQNPVSWAGWPWRHGWAPQWDPQQPLELHDRVSLVYACVDRVAAALSSMPLIISKDSEPQLPRTWLRNPDPDHYTHAGDAISEIVWSLLLRGNAWILPTEVGADGYPLRWQVLNPDRIEWDADWWSDRDGPMPWPYVVWDPAQNMFVPNRYERAARGVWTLLGDDGRVVVRYRRSDLLHIRHRARPGSVLGLAPLDAVWQNVRAISAYERVAHKIATRSGLPTQGILTTDVDLPVSKAREYKDAWQSRGDGDVAVMGSGITYQSLSLNPRDLALLELREFDGRQIATAFGVPPFMVNLAAAGDLTYSTTQGMLDYFWRSTLRTMAINIGRSLGTFLPGRSTVVFDADDYVRGSRQEEVHSLVEATGGPVMTRDEARSRLNLAPLGGDGNPSAQVFAVAVGGQ